MGQIKNIKLHIVTDIKHIPLHLCTIKISAPSSNIRITITNKRVDITNNMAQVESTDVKVQEATEVEETTMSDETTTTTTATTTTDEKMADDASIDETKSGEVLQEMTLVKRKRKISKPDLMDTGDKDVKRPSFPPAADT